MYQIPNTKLQREKFLNRGTKKDKNKSQKNNIFKSCKRGSRKLKAGSLKLLVR